MVDPIRRGALALMASLAWVGVSPATAMDAQGGVGAGEGSTEPPGYHPGSQAARRGAARFETAHLIPGARVDLAGVDRDDPAARLVALTLDDGPDPREPEMLALLEAADARATFFQVGERVGRRIAITRALSDAGHEVGCHSFTHPMMGRMSGEERDGEFARSIDALGAAGVRPAWFRPPFGDWDDDLVARARRFGMGTVTWTVDARDWKARETAESVVRRVKRGLDPAAVVLAHGTKPITLAALPEILAEGRRRGLRFVTVSEWFAAMTRLAGTGTVEIGAVGPG